MRAFGVSSRHLAGADIVFGFILINNVVCIYLCIALLKIQFNLEVY